MAKSENYLIEHTDININFPYIGMMNTDQVLLSLTRIAFLNAIVVSLLGVQFLFPPSFLIFMIIVPIVFILQTKYTNVWHIMISSFIVLVFSLSVFGVSIFLWALVYNLVGIIGGIAWRSNLIWMIRVLIIGLSYFAAIAILLLLFNWLTQMDLNEFIFIYNNIVSTYNLDFSKTLYIGVSVWVVSLSIIVDWLMGRILKQIDY